MLNFSATRFPSSLSTIGVNSVAQTSSFVIGFELLKCSMLIFHGGFDCFVDGILLAEEIRDASVIDLYILFCHAKCLVREPGNMFGRSDNCSPLSGLLVPEVLSTSSRALGRSPQRWT